MSLLGGMFNMGALDFSNMDFSNIKIPTQTPAPKYAPTIVGKPDPIDIVSDNTPKVKVEVDEPTGGMLFTKEPEVKSSVKPTPVVEPQAPTVMPTDFAPVKPQPQPSLFTEQQPLSAQQLKQMRDAGETFTLADPLAQAIQGERDKLREERGFEFGIGEDMFEVYQDDPVIDSPFGGDRLMGGAEGRLRMAQDEETLGRLTQLGYEPEYKLNEFQGFRFDPESMSYEYYDVSPDQTGQLIKGGILAVATAGVGNAIAGSSALAGMSATAQTAIGQGIAAGASTAIQGGDTDDILKSAVLGGVSGAVKGLEVDLDAATTAGDVAKANEIASTLNVVDKVKNAIDVVEAVENKNVLGAISSSMELAGVDGLVDYTQNIIDDSLSETNLGDLGNTVADWAFNNSDHIAEATVKFADTMIKGGDLGEASQDAVIEYIKDGGGIKDLLPESAGLDIDIDLEVPEVVKEVAQVIADGASAINRNVIKPAVETVEEVGQVAMNTVKEVAEPIVDVVRETGRATEEAYGRVEDLVKEELSDFDDSVLQPAKDTIVETAQSIEDYYKTTIEPTIEQGIEDVKEELAEFDDEILQPTKDTIIKTAENIENYYKTEIEPSIEQGIKDVKEELAQFDENVLQPIKKTAEGVIDAVDERLGEFDDEVLQPIKDDIIAVANSVDQGLSDFNKEVIKPALQSIENRLSAIDVDTSDLEKMIKGLFDMISFGQVANQQMIQAATAKDFDPVDLTTVQLTTPELVKGFEYDDLSNKLLA